MSFKCGKTFSNSTYHIVGCLLKKYYVITVFVYLLHLRRNLRTFLSDILIPRYYLVRVLRGHMPQMHLLSAKLCLFVALSSWLWRWFFRACFVFVPYFVLLELEPKGRVSHPWANEARLERITVYYTLATKSDVCNHLIVVLFTMIWTIGCSYQCVMTCHWMVLYCL